MGVVDALLRIEIIDNRRWDENSAILQILRKKKDIATIPAAGSR